MSAVEILLVVRFMGDVACAIEFVATGVASLAYFAGHGSHTERGPVAIIGRAVNVVGIPVWLFYLRPIITAAMVSP